MGGLLVPKTPSPYQQERQRLSEALGLLWVRRRSWVWEERAGAALCSCSGGNSPAHGLESFWGFIFSVSALSEPIILKQKRPSYPSERGN